MGWLILIVVTPLLTWLILEHIDLKKDNIKLNNKLSQEQNSFNNLTIKYKNLYTHHNSLLDNPDKYFVDLIELKMSNLNIDINNTNEHKYIIGVNIELSKREIHNIICPEFMIDNIINMVSKELKGRMILEL